MTAEQLEELLGKVTQGEWVEDGIMISGNGDVCLMGEPAQWSGDTPRMLSNCDNNATLIALAPSLARRVLAAEKLVEAGRVMADALKGHYIVPGSAAAWDAALTAYREASK